MTSRALASRGGSTAPGDAPPPPGDAAFAARVAGDDAEDDALADALGRFEDLDARDRDAREAHDAAWDARLAAFRDRCAALELAMRDRHRGEASALEAKLASRLDRDPPRWTPQLRAMRKERVSLVRARRFGDALDLLHAVEARERDEVEAHRADVRRDNVQRLEKLFERQREERAVLANEAAAEEERLGRARAKADAATARARARDEERSFVERSRATLERAMGGHRRGSGSGSPRSRSRSFARPFANGPFATFDPDARRTRPERRGKENAFDFGDENARGRAEAAVRSLVGLREKRTDDANRADRNTREVGARRSRSPAPLREVFGRSGGEATPSPRRAPPSRADSLASDSDAARAFYRDRGGGADLLRIEDAPPGTASGGGEGSPERTSDERPTSVRQVVSRPTSVRCSSNLPSPPASEREEDPEEPSRPRGSSAGGPRAGGPHEPPSVAHHEQHLYQQYLHQHQHLHQPRVHPLMANDAQTRAWFAASDARAASDRAHAAFVSARSGPHAPPPPPPHFMPYPGDMAAVARSISHGSSAVAAVSAFEPPSNGLRTTSPPRSPLAGAAAKSAADDLMASAMAMAGTANAPPPASAAQRRREEEKAARDAAESSDESDDDDLDDVDLCPRGLTPARRRLRAAETERGVGGVGQPGAIGADPGSNPPPRPAATGTRGPPLDLSRLALGGRGGAGGRGGGFEPGSSASYPSPPALARGPAAPASRPGEADPRRDAPATGVSRGAALMRRLHGPEDAYRSARERNAGSARAVGDLGQLGFPEYFFPSEKRSERAPGATTTNADARSDGARRSEGTTPGRNVEPPTDLLGGVPLEPSVTAEALAAASAAARRAGGARVGVRPGSPARENGKDGKNGKNGKNRRRFRREESQTVVVVEGGRRARARGGARADVRGGGRDFALARVAPEERDGRREPRRAQVRRATGRVVDGRGVGRARRFGGDVVRRAARSERVEHGVEDERGDKKTE